MHECMGTAMKLQYLLLKTRGEGKGGHPWQANVRGVISERDTHVPH